MGKISIVISAYNEEKKIEDCLRSVVWADEIILVDNSSSDKTIKIAQKYTSKIFTQPNRQMLNINKNYGFSKATGDWILSLDADERVTPELREEIKSTIEQLNNGTINGFWLPRKNIIFGKWIKYTGWYPDYQLRLFKNGKGKFPEKHVHEMIKIDRETAYFKNPLTHYNFENLSQFFHKHINIYAPNEADQLIKKGYEFKWEDAIRFPAKEFVSRFFAREGYKDGMHGLMLSLLMAFYHFVIFALIWEKKQFLENTDKNFLEETEKEFKKASKDTRYWYYVEHIKFVKNPLVKIIFKVKNKFFL